MTESAGPARARIGVPVFLLGLGSMSALGVTWPFLVGAALYELIRAGGRRAGLVFPLGGGILLLFLLGRIYLSPDQDSHVSGTVGLLGLLSYFVTYSISSQGWESCRVAVFAIVAGSTAHALLNLGTIIRDFGLFPSTRLFNDVWTGSFYTATGQATLWVPVIGTIPYLLFATKSRASRVLGWVLLTTTLLAAAVLASRTMLGLIVLSLLIGSALFLSWIGQISRLVTVLSSAFVLIVIAHYALPTDFIDRLPLVSRLASGQADLQNDPRLKRWSYYVSHMWESRDGGRRLQNSVGYAHNLWLDCFDADGAIPFLLLVLFSVAFMVGMVRVAKRLPRSTGGLFLLGGVGVAWMIQAATEPLIDLAPSLFAAGCGFAGACSGVLMSLCHRGIDDVRGVSTPGGQLSRMPD